MKILPVVFIFLLAFSLRLLFILYFPQPKVANDAAEYDTIGLNIAQGNGFANLDGIPTARREPIYPLFLAFVYLIFGHSYLAARIFQAIFGALTCIFIYFIGKRLFGKNCGILGGTSCALYPHFIVTTGFVLTETLFTFLLLISIYFLIKGLEKRPFLILSGIFLGLTTLTRSITLLLPLFFLISFFLLNKKKDAIINFAILSLFMIITIAPWTIRNYIRFHVFIPTICGNASNVWAGTYLPWDGDWKYWDLSDLEKISAGYTSILELDKKLYKEAFKNITANPSGYLKLVIKKVYRLWFWIPGGKEVLKPYPKIKITLAIFQYIVIFLCLLGIISGWERWKIFLPLLVIILYITIIHSFFFLAIPRYNLPIFPYVLLFSANGILKILRKR